MHSLVDILASTKKMKEEYFKDRHEEKDEHKYKSIASHSLLFPIFCSGVLVMSAESINEYAAVHWEYVSRLVIFRPFRKQPELYCTLSLPVHHLLLEFFSLNLPISPLFPVHSPSFFSSPITLLLSYSVHCSLEIFRASNTLTPRACSSQSYSLYLCY